MTRRETLPRSTKGQMWCSRSEWDRRKVVGCERRLEWDRLREWKDWHGIGDTVRAVPLQKGQSTAETTVFLCVSGSDVAVALMRNFATSSIKLHSGSGPNSWAANLGSLPFLSSPFSASVIPVVLASQEPTVAHCGSVFLVIDQDRSQLYSVLQLD
jgi:hypothetical protein